MPDEYEDMGTQFDGEPSAVVPVEPETKEEPVTEQPEAEQAQPETESIEEKTDAEKEEHEKKKTGSQREREKRIRAEERARQLEERLTALERGVKPSEAPKPVTTPDAPKIEDFETHAEWTAAMVRHEAKKLREEEKAQEMFEAAKSEWERKVEAGRDKFEDFDEAIESSAAPSPLLAQRLYKPSVPPEVVYHLATHPKELAEINRMRDPGDVAEALADLKSRLTKPAPAAPKRETKAPPPISPVAPSGMTPPPMLHAGFEEF